MKGTSSRIAKVLHPVASRVYGSGEDRERGGTRRGSENGLMADGYVDEETSQPLAIGLSLPSAPNSGIGRFIRGLARSQLARFASPRRFAGRRASIAVLLPGAVDDARRCGPWSRP